MYGGRQALPEGVQEEMIEVEDLQYARIWQAYFDTRTHLLIAEIEIKGGRQVRRQVREYRPAADVLMSYEVWTYSGRGLSMERLETTLNSGLAPSLFRDPVPRSWEPGRWRPCCAAIVLGMEKSHG